MTDNIVELTASELPVKIWNWLHVNDTKIKLPQQVNTNSEQFKNQNHKSQQNIISFGNLPDGVTIDELQPSDFSHLQDMSHISGAIGTEFQSWLSGQGTFGYHITVAQSKSKKTPIYLKLTIPEGTQAAAQLLFDVKEGCSANVVIECDSPEMGEGVLALSVMCNLLANAELSIHQVQLLGQGYQYISDIGANQDDSSELKVVRVNLGGKNSYLGLKSSLEGKGAGLNSRLAYLSKDAQKLDVNDVVLHKGKMTLSDLNSEGVLLDQAEKNYKGTIDLQHGCAGAKGQELETVLLLSDDVVNKTVPLILCGEEDVEGNHGASIGKIEEDTLLYMESRGIPEEQARMLIVNGRLNQIIEQIPDQKLIAKASTFIKEVFTNESRLS